MSVWQLAQINIGTMVAPSADPDLLINMPVRNNVDGLAAFVSRSSDADFMHQRQHGFPPFKGAFQALWRVPAGQRPEPAVGFGRPWRLGRSGSSAQAFGFKTAFPASVAVIAHG
jgi:hypothetical protein